MRVYSTDASGNRSEVREGSLRTLAVEDMLAPQVLAGPLAVAVKDSTAQIEWTMDEEAAGSLFFGAGKQRREVPLEEFRRHQRVSLTRLSPGTGYTYEVRMEEASGGSHTPAFLSTHPSNAKRKGNLEDWMSRARKRYSRHERADKGTTVRWK